MQALTFCDTEIMTTRTRSRSVQGPQFKGAMEDMSHRFKMQAPTPEYTCGKPGTQSIQRGAGYQFTESSNVRFT